MLLRPLSLPDAPHPLVTDILIGINSCTLRFNNTQLHLIESSESATVVRLSPQRFTQLVFGYRPVAWTLQQGEQSPPDEVVTVLKVLFPYGHTWIPSSDWF